MTLWLTRAGKYGEHEDKFLESGFISICWEGAFQKSDLTNLSRSKLKDVIEASYPDESKSKLSNWLGQIAIPAISMQIDDLVAMPLKSNPAIAIGKVVSNYIYCLDQPAPYKHQRKIQWLKTDIPRQRFKQDLLYSFGAFMTFCEIMRNNAEQRVQGVLETGYDTNIYSNVVSKGSIDIAASAEGTTVDLAQTSEDQLFQFIETNFKGDRLEILVEEIFKAQGYFTYRSPKGADKGVDVLAAKGSLGFESPKICIQVKSGGEVPRQIINELQGTMQSVGADYGLLVSWDGFKGTVDKDERQSRFFNIRLWNSRDLLNQIQKNYDNFSDVIKADLPLKRLWVLAADW